MPLRVTFWGTYDLGKPRNRILILGLEKNGVEVTRCHRSIWDGVEDKYQLNNWRQRMPYVLKTLVSYPILIWKFIRLPKHDAVVVGYMGQMDLLVIWPFARLRRIPVIWDSYLSLFGTVSEDRRLYGPRHLLSRLLFIMEWIDVRAADVILVDTNSHGDYFSGTFRADAKKIHRIFVGAETNAFFPAPAEPMRNSTAGSFSVLFYGQFIPLHGLDTILAAIRLCKDEAIKWQLIGNGQETAKVERLLDELGQGNIEWIDWVPYAELVHHIHQADLCLGIFGDSDKALRVIPNKVFQIIAAGGNLVTADTPAIRELLQTGSGISLVPPADPEALATEIRRQSRQYRAGENQVGFASNYRNRITPVAIGEEFLSVLQRFLDDPKLVKSR